MRQVADHRVGKGVRLLRHWNMRGVENGELAPGIWQTDEIPGRHRRRRVRDARAITRVILILGKNARSRACSASQQAR